MNILPRICDISKLFMHKNWSSWNLCLWNILFRCYIRYTVVYCPLGIFREFHSFFLYSILLQLINNLFYLGGMVLFYVTTAMNYIWVQRMSLLAEDEYVFGRFWWPNDSQGWMSSKFPNISYAVEEKASTRKFTRPGIEPGTIGWEATMLSLDHSGGLYFVCNLINNLLEYYI